MKVDENKIIDVTFLNNQKKFLQPKSIKRQSNRANFNE